MERRANGRRGQVALNPENLGPRRFQTTRWSLILAAADPQSATADEALASLCEMYWLPIYAFIRRTGVSAEDARDLTQAFFTRVLEKGFFGQARQERGRFRSFLLTAVRHFLANQRDAEQALQAAVTLPCDSPPCLLSSTTAAWASGPNWAAAAPRVPDVCKGWRPRTRRRH